MPRRSRALALGALALALYTAWALVVLRPIWRLWTDHLVPDRVDPLFNLYVLKWGAHQLRLGLPDLWNANFFFPTHGALTFSDHLLGPAFQLALLAAIVPGAIAAYNVLFFTSFVLSGLTTAWVLRRAGCSLPAAFLGGAIFAFSPFRLMQANHLQILLAQWIPLTLWAWDRLLAERTARRALVFLPLYLLHLTGGCYLAYMIHLPMLFFLAGRLLAGEGRALLGRRSLAVLLPTGTLAVAAAASLFLPYASVSSRLGLVRNPEEIVTYGATFASYLAPSPRQTPGRLLYALWHPRRTGLARTALFRSENSLFAGVLPTALALWGLAALWHRCRYRRHRPEVPIARGRRLLLALLLSIAVAALAVADVLTLHRSLLREEGGADLSWFVPLGATALGSLCLWLLLRRRWGGGGPLDLTAMEEEGLALDRGLLLSGLGCFLLSFPAVYLLMMRVLPGLSGMRVPARFDAFVSLSVALFAARGIDDLCRRVASPRRRALGWAAAAVLLFVDLLPRPLHWAIVPREEEFPPVYAWLAGRPEVRALLEVPVRPRGGDVEAMYYSTRHWKPIANGYSGYLPPSYLEINQRARFLPDEDGLTLLRQLGISHLLVHSGQLAPLRARRLARKGARPGAQPGTGPEDLIRPWEERFLGHGVELAYVAGRDRVYRIL